MTPAEMKQKCEAFLASNIYKPSICTLCSSFEIAKWALEMEAENARLKETISYLPKVPTEPYEKELAKKVMELEKENQSLQMAIRNLSGNNNANMAIKSKDGGHLSIELVDTSIIVP